MQNIGGVPGAPTLTSSADALQVFKENYAEVLSTVSPSNVYVDQGDDNFGGDAYFPDHDPLPGVAHLTEAASLYSLRRADWRRVYSFRPGCMRQQRHTDFPEFNMTLNAPEKPNSTIVALCDNTQLHFYVGPDKQLVTVDMKAGDCCFFACDVLHGGAEWQGQQPNFRLFMYWPTTDMFVPWTAKSAAVSLSVAKFRVPNTNKCYDDLNLKTNPLSISFQLHEYNSYLYDFEVFALLLQV
jgi:hypothetical protein